jgi:hypothetical protein
VELKSYLRDGERMSDNNNSGSMKSLRQLETTTGRTTASIFQVTVDKTILIQYQASLQDGGNCSTGKMALFRMKKERYWMLQVALTLKTETSLCTISMERSTRDGRSSMPMSIQMSQLRDN